MAALTRLERLARIYGNDLAAIRRRADVDARLTLLGGYSPPAPTAPTWSTGDLLGIASVTRAHVDALLAAGLIDDRGRRVAHDERGRTIYRDPDTGRWYRLDARGRRDWIDDDEAD